MLGLSGGKFEPYWRLSCLVLPLAVYTSFDMIIPAAQVLLALVALFLLVVAVVASQKSRGKRFPPGPFPWPIVGNVKELRELSRKLGGQHAALLELSRRYGSPVVSLRLGGSGGEACYAVNGVEGIQEVLASDAFEGRPWNYFIKLRNMGKRKGLTMNDGPIWRAMRNWFVKSMRAVGYAKREMADSILEELQSALERIGQVDGSVQQMQPVIVPIIINVLWTFAAGKRFDESRLQDFINLMKRRAAAFDMTGGLLSAYPWIRFVAPNYSGYNILTTVNREFRTFLMENIEEHKRNHVAGSEADLIDMFLNEMYGGKGVEAGFDDDQLIIILLDVLLAGLNVTATTLDFLFLHMLLNQDSQRQLHEEIDRVIGRDRLPDLADRIKMPYAEAVILESQRLSPVVPVIGPRRVLYDCKLHGYDVPRETFIVINLHSINSDPKLYPEPEAFKPQRFVKDGQLIRDENLLFFGRGKRQCPGIPLAKSALFLVFVGIMQRYQILPVPGRGAPSLRVKPGMTMAPEPYDVYLVSRSKLTCNACTPN